MLIKPNTIYYKGHTRVPAMLHGPVARRTEGGLCRTNHDVQ